MSESLYDKIGGRKAVENLVDDLYERIMRDEELSPFFSNTSLETLKAMQYEFFSVALGGDAKYTGPELSHAHSTRGIQRKHFQKYVEHLFDSLKEFHLSEADTTSIIDSMNLHVDDIVGTPGISS